MSTAAVSSQNASGWLSLPAHLVIAGVMAAVEGWIGIGLLGGFALVFAIVKICGIVFSHSPVRQGLKAAGMYMFVAVATIWWIGLSSQLAQRHAVPVIAACDAYNAKYGHYPPNLNVLVPEFLPSIPRAGLTVISRDFSYVNDGDGRINLYFPAMFYGVYFFDLQKRNWWAND